MPRAPFSHYLLRTTDVNAASAFYDTVLGRRGDGVVRLHEAAIARGARPHWLGHICVQESGGVEAAAAQFVERGATRLGPEPGVADFVVLRDPGGAIVALTDRASGSSAGVVWHNLSTLNPSDAARTYSDLFGWSIGVARDVGLPGEHLEFAYNAGEPAVGLISDIEGRPEVHTHWLFFFAVESLDGSIESVRKLGGVVVGPITLPNGVRIAACDDPQGAAFGLIQRDEAVRLTQ